MKQGVKVEILLKRSKVLNYIVAAFAFAGLALFSIPALLDTVSGGLLQSLIPPAVYNAVHELRHLLGIPCH